MSGFAGVALETGDDYTPWGVALSALWRRPSSDTYWAEQMYDQGTLPFEHLMIDDTIHNIAAGVHDAAIEDWLMALLRYQASGRHMVVALFPEMNGNWTPYGQEEPLDHQVFIDVYRSIVNKGRAMGLTHEHILWCFAPNDRGFPTDTLESWYPGDEWCDVIGGSVYSWGGIFPDAPYETFTDLADRYVREIRTFTNRPIVITQTGCVNDSGNRAWLDDAVFYTDTYTNIEGFIWFSIDWFRYEPGPDTFRLQVSGLDSSPPLHWFLEEPMKTLDVPALWTAAGLTVTYLDGWDTPTSGPYLWRHGDPVCSMWHHTATSAYTPNRAKANVWAGLARGDRLYQTGGGVPTLVVANAYPAPISSGYGQKQIIDGAAADTPNDRLARGADDYPKWAANRSAWNTEVVLDGVGAVIDPDVWEMLVTAATILHSHMGWTEHRALSHAQFTKRKIDLWDGADLSARETMIRFRNDMEDNMFTHFKIGQEYAEWESVSWWLYMLKGGTIDANGNSSQVQSKLPWKTNVRLVQSEDFILIAELIGLSNANRIALTDSGLYRFGKELASLRQKAYT